MIWLAALLFQSAVTVRVYEPVAATPWTHSHRGECYGDTLEIIQHIRPEGKPVTIRLNGREPEGDLAELKRELGMPGAAYRFQFLCSNPAKRERGIVMRWSRGYSGEGEPVFRSGGATFRVDKKTEVRPSQPTEAEGFWFS